MIITLVLQITKYFTYSVRILATYIISYTYSSIKSKARSPRILPRPENKLTYILLVEPCNTDLNIHFSCILLAYLRSIVRLVFLRDCPKLSHGGHFPEYHLARGTHGHHGAHIRTDLARTNLSTMTATDCDWNTVVIVPDL